MWNEGYHWALGDFMAGSVDQGGKSVEDAKPIGYYYRAGPSDIGGSTGVGGLYNVLGPTNESVEDASYVKLREASLSYNIGAVGGQGNWTLGLVGRNLYTWTKYRGYDPEVGRGGQQLNNAALNGIDYFSFPNLRTFTARYQRRSKDSGRMADPLTNPPSAAVSAAALRPILSGQ